jgi:hypothetical protein
MDLVVCNNIPFQPHWLTEGTGHHIDLVLFKQNETSDHCKMYRSKSVCQRCEHFNILPSLHSIPKSFWFLKNFSFH